MTRELVVEFAIAVGAGGIVLFVGWGVASLLLPRLARLLRRTPTEVDDILIRAIRPQIPLLFGLLGVGVASRLAPITDAALDFVERGVGIGVLFLITLAAASFVGELVRSKADHLPQSFPASTLTQNLIRVVVMGLGLLVIAGQLGIEITPILTALGVGSLAVALALQPTLANFFAGLHITLARHIRVGDFVELEQGGQGYVLDIGWRSTQIRELPNNVIIVPNARLAEMVVKNDSLPVAEQAALVQVGVSYGSDLRKVESVTIAVARETLRHVEGGVAEFDPFIRYHTFGDSSVDFTVILRVRQFVDRYLVSHEFIKRLHERYVREGIEIPFPQRVLHLPSWGPFEAGLSASGAGVSREPGR